MTGKFTPVFRELQDGLQSAGHRLEPLPDGVAGKIFRTSKHNKNEVEGIDTPVDTPEVPAAPAVPTVSFSRSRAPGIAKTFDEAVEGGAPTRLTRADADTARANRREALRNQPSPPDGRSLDEYPFASTTQGGSGATVRPVPTGEQNYQGGKLSSFYRNNGIRPGDSFDVTCGP